MKKNISLLLAVLLVASMLLSACAPAATQAPAPTQAPAVTQPQAAPTEAPKPTEAPAAVPTEAPKPTEAPAAPAAPANPDLILATTTSTQDSGLLDVLIPVFEKQTGYKVKTVAVGTGQALKMGEEGNADVLLVHAPASEKAYMDKGFGSERALVMHNDFIIVGPKDDPAKVKDTKTAVDAYKAIAAAKAPFVTRGDDSGTNKAELALWKKAGLAPSKDDAWYINTGQGMGASLKVASEKGAYIFTDRATYLANKDSLNLDILSEGDAALLNVYHVIVVNPEKWPKINLEGAKAFYAFMIAKDTQDLIGKFGVEKFGQPLFTPDAGKPESAVGL